MPSRGLGEIGEAIRETPGGCMFAVGMSFIVLIGLGAMFSECASASSNPRLDWAANQGGWCCAKPRRWCEPSQKCRKLDPSPGGPCIEWVAGEHCEDLCDEWREVPGGRGKACR